MKKNLFLLLGAIVFLSFTSCSSDIAEEQTIQDDGYQFYGVNIPSENADGVRGFIDPTTRYTIWEENDVVGVFATTGPQQSQVEYVVKEVEDGGLKAKFLPGSYFNRSGYKFVSYYPIQEKYLRYNSDISLSLSGQHQIANNDVSAQSELLFNVTGETENENDSTFRFAYTRFWALAYTDFTMPKAGTWTKFTLRVIDGSELFHENINYNFAKEGGAGITNADNKSSITLTLGANGEGITTAEDEPLQLFMLICPAAMQNKALVAEIQDNNGLVYKRVYSNGVGSFDSNQNYHFTGTPEKDQNIDDVKGTGSNFIVKE